MKKEIRDTRNELRKKAVRLSTLQYDPLCTVSEEISKEINKTYDKFRFYDKMIKANEKLRRE